ncbi:MAG: hypothetical protein M3280_03255 [Actinomycetota bacterium]|nr:hypothetical protein [Actinomycetota bacterium]
MADRLLWWLMILCVFVLALAGIFYVGSQGPTDCASEAGVRHKNCVERTDR